VQTPNLDRLVREGIRFENCFVSSAQTSRLHTPTPEYETTVIDHLKDAGYFCGAYRKVHQGAPFDKRWNFYGNAQAPFSKFFDARPVGRPALQAGEISDSA